MASAKLGDEMHVVLLKYEHLVLRLVDAVQRLVMQSAGQAKKLPQEVVRRPETIMKELLEMDRQLQEGVQKLCEYEEVQSRIRLTTQKLEKRERTIADITSTLVELEKALQFFRDAATVRLERARAARADPLPLTQVVAHARHVSYTTFGKAEQGGAPGVSRPPLPDEQMLRSSILYNTLDIPETAKEQIEQSQRSKVEAIPLVMDETMEEKK
mmetsp:Transcript_9404/g.26384  ORF Transcript_9404/g.26384 Transcript_9404/m.26384 type:complete len:213 (+) Transcript_9404:168-806(+)